MMRRSSSPFGASVLILALAWFSVGVGTASAQVPYDMSYQGRLTDAVGAPLIGPVNLQMRVYDVISGGSPLYIEDHIAVVVDDVGAFSLRLGAGSSLLGTFNTALFAGVNRYLEVVVDGAALTPRLIIGSVPYAMHADNAASAQAAADAAQATADANAAGISTNAPVVAANATAIAEEAAARTAADAVHDADIAANAAGISANASGITGNATAISANTVDTSANTTGISTNATAITGEATDRAAADATNATAISGNTAEISTNAAALTALDARIAALEASCATRFCACSDGVTVEDTATGLLWERKTGTGDVHDVSNLYTWSSTGTAADGTAYTVFLPGLNGSSFAGHADWRLPIISELQSILVGSGVETVANAVPADPNSGLNGTGQATTCAGPPCIDPDFAAVAGPTASLFYFSSSTDASSTNAWGAYFQNGNAGGGLKTHPAGFSVRAVRAGSCSS